jgi:hypothetical protein
MKATDALTLEACLIALAKLETELPIELHQQVQDLGRALEANDPEAVDRLRELVIHHADLHQHYDVARLTLQEQYRSQERAKGHWPGSNRANGTCTLALEQLAVSILRADDFRSAAQGLLKGNGASSTKAAAQTELQPFLQALHRTVATLDAASVRLMKELERKPATLENLSYGLNMGLDQVRGLCNRLRTNGYISPLTSGFWTMVLPLFGVYPHKSAQIHEQTFLTLTAKGYFKLNPVIVFHRDQG